MKFQLIVGTNATKRTLQLVKLSIVFEAHSGSLFLNDIDTECGANIIQYKRLYLRVTNAD